MEHKLETLQRTADKVQLSEYYTLRADAARELVLYATQDPFEAIILAFKYGYAKGGRAAKAGRYSERRA